jgi:hypothetical protein
VEVSDSLAYYCRVAVENFGVDMAVGLGLGRKQWRRLGDFDHVGMGVSA